MKTDLPVLIGSWVLSLRSKLNISVIAFLFAGFATRLKNGMAHLALPCKSNSTLSSSCMAKRGATRGHGTSPSESSFKWIAQVRREREKGGVDAEIAEMREYYRAFIEQDDSIRDYKQYFPKYILALSSDGFFVLTV